MKKINGIKMMAVVLAGMIATTGCSKSDSKALNDSDKKTFTIGISQFSEHPALDNTRLGFEDGLKELGIEAEIVYQNAQGDIPNTLAIAQKFVKDEVDLILAIATPPAQSAMQVSKKIPVLFSAVSDPVRAGIVADWENVGGNVSGTSNKAPVASQLKMFKEINPSIKTVGIIYNTSEANAELQKNDVINLAPNEGLEIITVGITSVNEISQALDSLLKKVDAVYCLNDNLVASSVELVSKKLIEYNKISISAEESQVDGGILITNGLSFYDLGKQTAQMAKEILIDGRDISTIPVGLAEKTTITVNQKTLKALGLNENIPIFKDAANVGE